MDENHRTTINKDGRKVVIIGSTAAALRAVQQLEARRINSGTSPALAAHIAGSEVLYASLENDSETFQKMMREYEERYMGRYYTDVPVCAEEPAPAPTMYEFAQQLHKKRNRW